MEGICERVAENGDFGGCFQHPFHCTPTEAPGRFNLFLAGCLWRVTFGGHLREGHTALAGQREQPMARILSVIL
jgi:hypothetical protein